MPKIKVDLRFATVALNGHVARRHAEISLRRLDSLAQEAHSLVLSKLEESGYSHDEVERDIAYKEIYWLEEELPRLELYGVLFVLFAVFESTVKRLPSIVLPSSKTTIAETKGDNFVAKATRFFRDQLSVSLFDSESQRETLLMLGDLRNAIAHATGDMSMLNATLQKRVQEWARKHEGLRIVEGQLVLSPTFVRMAAEVVEQSLSGAVNRLRQAYKPHGQVNLGEPNDHSGIRLA